MKMQPLNFVGGAYADEARPWASQDVCNWLPTQAEAENTLTPAKYETPPGLKPFVEAGTGVVRGVHDAESRLFTVIGNQLYQISNTGVAIPRGGIPDVRRVQMAHNQITGGNEVLIVNGSAGFIWNTATNTFNKITDPGYPGAISAVFIDGYFVQIEPGRRYAFNSDLADGLSYNTLDRFTSEVSPDELVGLASSNNELFMLSDSSGEFFENTGSAQQPFRSKRIAIDKGCAGTHTIATMDNTVFWLGNDGSFYMLEGYVPRRISVRPIEQAIRGLNWAQAFAFIWLDSGHSVCYWTFPDGQTWGYDASTGKWHRRASKGLNRWRVNCTTHSQRRWISGDFQTGRLWQIDWDYQLEGDQEIEREATGAVVHDAQSRVVMSRLEVIADMGQEPTVAIPFPVQPTGPSISGDAPNGTEGVAYAGYQYIGAGTGTLTYTISAGALPTGLSMSSAGLINTAEPTTPETYEFTVRVTQTNGLWAEVEDSITIAEAP